MLINDEQAQKLLSTLAFLQCNAQGICALLLERQGTASLVAQPEPAQASLAKQRGDHAAATAAACSKLVTPEKLVRKAVQAKRNSNAHSAAAESTPEQLKSKAENSVRDLNAHAAEATSKQLKRKAENSGRNSNARAAEATPKQLKRKATDAN